MSASDSTSAGPWTIVCPGRKSANFIGGSVWQVARMVSAALRRFADRVGQFPTHLARSAVPRRECVDSRFVDGLVCWIGDLYSNHWGGLMRYFAAALFGLSFCGSVSCAPFQNGSF